MEIIYPAFTFLASFDNLEQFWVFLEGLLSGCLDDILKASFLPVCRGKAAPRRGEITREEG